MRIGVVGLGVVGSAIYNVMKKHHEDVRGYDIRSDVSKNTRLEVFHTDAIFLALPTHVNKGGRLDPTLITRYLIDLNRVKYKGLVVIKSTLPLGYLKSVDLPSLRIIYSPEFLHTREAEWEFTHPQYMIAAGVYEDFLAYRDKVLHWFPNILFSDVSDSEAEIIKLAMNAFAAMKISFVNEIERLCKKFEADPVIVMGIIRKDKRCASEYSHPGKGAYEGRCLPKDILELINAWPESILFPAVHAANEQAKKEAKK